MSNTDQQPHSFIAAPKSEKQIKIERVLDNERTIDHLMKLRRVINDAKEYEDVGETSLCVVRRGCYERIPSPEFMSHKTYIKLYLNEIDETIERLKKEQEGLIK